MRTVKSFFGVFGALLPVAYCGGLLYYFAGAGGSIEEASGMGLGPTMLGLFVVGLFFCIPLILRFARLITGSRSQGPGNPAPKDKSTFDADAVIARYIAANPAEPAPAPRPAPKSAAAKPAGFGRRTA